MKDGQARKFGISHEWRITLTTFFILSTLAILFFSSTSKTFWIQKIIELQSSKSKDILSFVGKCLPYLCVYLIRMEVVIGFNLVPIKW
jgi:hypothetical protein